MKTKNRLPNDRFHEQYERMEKLVELFPLLKKTKAYRHKKFWFKFGNGSHRGLYHNDGSITIWNSQLLGEQENEGRKWTVDCVLIHEMCHALWHEVLKKEMKTRISLLHSKLKKQENKFDGYIFSYGDARDDPEEMFGDQVPRAIFQHPIGWVKPNPRLQIVRPEMVIYAATDLGAKIDEEYFNKAVGMMEKDPF